MPITKKSYNRSDGQREFSVDVPAGVYPAKLVEVKEGTKRKWKSEEYEECIDFCYKFRYQGEIVDFIRKTSFAIGKNSNLYKDLQVLAPSALRDGTIAEDDKLTALLNSLPGATVQIMVGDRHSDEGKRYPDFMGLAAGGAPSQSASAPPQQPQAQTQPDLPPAAPLDAQPAGGPAPTPSDDPGPGYMMEGADVSFADDDIPF